MPTSDEDILKPKKRWNYKKIGLITGGILVAVIVITVLVVVLTDGEDDKTTETTPISTETTPNEITLSDILNGALATTRFSSRWISGKDVLVKDDDGLHLIDVVTLESKLLLAPENYGVLSEAFTYSLSPDNTHIIVGYDQVKGYRHSYEASYVVVDLISDNEESKTESKTETKIFINDPTDKLTLVQWSPIGQGLVIIYQNNIYYKENLLATPKQITTDGLPKVFNGIPDWVYEEEVFGSNSAIRFSPNGNKLAYIQFDDTHVNTFEYTYYGKPGTEEAQYPTNMEVSYPKAGTTNPTVKLYQVDLSSAVKSEIDVPSALSNEDHIITTVSWANNENIVATWMNRVQNTAFIQVCNPTTCSIIDSFAPTDGWVELFTNPLYNADGSRFALIISQDQDGGAGGYRHLTLFSTDSNIKIVLTKGKYVVTQLLYWNTELNYIFYLANTEDDSRVSHVYAIKAEQDALSQCLTCGLDPLWNEYKYFSASFSKDEQIFALNALGPAIPRADIFSYSAVGNTINLKHERVWATNEALQDKLNNLDTPFPTTEYDDEIILNSGYIAQVSMILPGDIDRSGTTKYPVLINVYGGPDSYSVTFQWGTSWGTYLAAAKNIIYVRIDGRGSGLRGDKLLNEIYQKLGTVEIEDQIETAKALAKKYPFIDRDHIAIWGWSYGGYAAGLALARDTEDVFKCAVSVAPVTDWTYYDTIYTERYMGRPIDNKVGYDNSRLSTLYQEFEGKNYFLIHGTLDDNVHYQQAMALSRTLEKNAVLFKQMSYPDEDHSLSGVQEHLYRTLDRYFSDCFHLEH